MNFDYNSLTKTVNVGLIRSFVWLCVEKLVFKLRTSFLLSSVPSEYC